MLTTVIVFLSERSTQAMCIALLFQSSLIGYPLSDKELLALVDQILPQDVIDSLQQSGLDLKTSGNPQATLEEVQQHETVSKLRQLLNLGMKKLSVCRQLL